MGGQLIGAVRFADDQAMVASSNAGLQRIMDSLQTASGDYGMRINIKKTKVMRISGTEGRKTNIEIEGQKFEQVKQFCYLGKMIMEERQIYILKLRLGLYSERSRGFSKH